MKFLAILLLSSRLLPSLTQDAGFRETDCDDKDVFKAVAVALGSYNSENQNGNQFVLDRITEATRKDGHETFYSIKYQVKEGDCPVQSGKSWQECDYKDAQEAATGECIVTVGKRKNDRFSVATQTCHITPAEGPVVTTEYICLGCSHPISMDSPELEPLLKHGVQHFNNNTDHTYFFALGEVKSAHRQVVAGWNFEITYSIVQTNCSKNMFQLLTSDCKFLLNGDVGECRDNVFVDTHQRLASFSQNCEIYPGEDFVLPAPKVCPGCPHYIPVDSPELKEALTHSITKLNAENNETFYFKTDTVRKATVQVVAGQKFSIEFTARETTCSKENNQELTESCEVKSPGQRLICNAEVYVIPWEKKVYPTVKCEPLGMVKLRRRPPGFSPFRSVEPLKKTEETTVSPPYTSVVPAREEEQDSEKEQDPNHGHGWGHEKQIHRLGHGHKPKHGLGHGHQKQHGLGHGHQQQHGLGHGHQPKHHMGHDLAHGHKHEHKHGHNHGKLKNKDKNNGKHDDWRAEHFASPSEDSTTSSTQTEEKTEGPSPTPFLAQPGTAVTSSGFQDSDLIETAPPTSPSIPIEEEDDWIPPIQIETNSLSFKLIPDFPETTSPKCPGRPWKPVNGQNPTVETKEFHDLDLFDALD